MRKFLIPFLALAMFVTGLAARSADGPTMVPLKFTNHFQAGFPDQDVFIESGDGTGQVWRVSGSVATDPALLAKEVFAAASAVTRDPHKLGATPLGPFAKGPALGFTLDRWLRAAGTGSYEEKDGQAKLSLDFRRLVPNGTYSLLCSRITTPPAHAEAHAPCGPADGSQSVFMADGSGFADVRIDVPAFPDATGSAGSYVAVVYHSDGQTHGASPGDFGLNSHIQIFAAVEPPLPAIKDALVSCIAVAADVREASIASSWDTYSAMIKNALATRKEALADAWLLADKKPRVAAVNNVWRVWRADQRKASADWRKAKNAAWNEFTKKRRACGKNAINETWENVSYDAFF